MTITEQQHTNSRSSLTPPRSREREPTTTAAARESSSSRAPEWVRAAIAVSLNTLHDESIFKSKEAKEKPCEIDEASMEKDDGTEARR
ncbi:hypothetical protein DEO72_LG3g1135 [Vigna unguiculata]|uniref:Uncharacterized protein n=1 Tax=Vigna unguiculata TaxID=3917 RepID=A0A4D6LDD5_VIGUN|nr:hypothetical protein DEO72_LG3g1135 [Vigna unguiculata]